MKNLTLFLLFYLGFLSQNFGQKRCYTYDVAGNRILRDLSCDVVCTTLVSNTNDNGPGSLRKAIQCANAGETVNFATFIQNDEVSLTTGTILIDKPITISQTTNQIVLSNGLPFFQVTSSGVIMQNLRFYVPCNPSVASLAIQNNGTLTLQNVTIESDESGLCNHNFINNQGNLIISGTVNLIKP